MKKILLIATLAFCTFILRTIKLEDLFYFTYDESVFAFVGRRLLLWHHFPLIGGVTPFGVHVAPYFYWFFAFTLVIGKLNPLIWGYVSAFIASVTTVIIYKLGEKIDSKKVGFFAAVLWAFSYLANIYDRHFWGLTFGPLFSLLVVYCLYQIIKGREKFVYLLGFLLALIIHADLSFYLFLLLVVIGWIVFKIPIRKSTFLAIGIIVLSFLPLVIFDVRHNFSNTKPFINFLKSGKNTPSFSKEKAIDNALLFPRTFSRLVYTGGDGEISKQYSYCRNYQKEKMHIIPPLLVASYAIILIFFSFWSFKKNKNVGWKLISLLMVLYFVGIQIYGTILRADIFEHYISGLLAMFILILAKSVSVLPKKLAFLFIYFFIVINIYGILIAKNDLGLKEKRRAIEFTMNEVGQKPFSLDSLSTCWKLSGYRYLFTVYGREPVKSYVDPNFAYLYGTTPVWDKHPDTVVAFVAHDFVPETDEFYKRYAQLKSHETKSAVFGALEVIIMDNTSGWFDKNEE